MGALLRGMEAGFRVGMTKQSPSYPRQSPTTYYFWRVRYEHLTPRVPAYGGDTGEIASSSGPLCCPAPRNDATHTTSQAHAIRRQKPFRGRCGQSFARCSRSAHQTRGPRRALASSYAPSARRLMSAVSSTRLSEPCCTAAIIALPTARVVVTPFGKTALRTGNRGPTTL